MHNRSAQYEHGHVDGQTYSQLTSFSKKNIWMIKKIKYDTHP
jgi:hypothetical protein